MFLYRNHKEKKIVRKKKYSKYCIESKSIEKRGFRITVNSLLELIQKAKKVGKKPLLRLIFKNHKEIIKLEAEIEKK